MCSGSTMQTEDSLDDASFSEASSSSSLRMMISASFAVVPITAGGKDNLSSHRLATVGNDRGLQLNHQLTTTLFQFPSHQPLTVAIGHYGDGHPLHVTQTWVFGFIFEAIL